MRTFIGYWKPRDQLVILHKGTLCTEVEFDFGIKYLQAELGPESDFEIICRLDSEYDQLLPLTIRIKDFDNGATDESMAMKIVVEGLTKELLQNKGGAVLDIGNYIYREIGLQYEMTPEFGNHGEPKDSLTWFVSKARFKAQDGLMNFIAGKTGKSFALVKAGACRFDIVMKPEGIA